MQTARQLADSVQIARREAWDNNDPTTAIVLTGTLGTNDLATVQRVVTEAGYTGDDYESMVDHVSQLLVGKVQALDDKMPATGGD